ncbi:MAG: putative DNA binding domain-containing protein [Chloroflexi bacterium]|nr:putative DNA binding domain-containing protein [Chloroflexota bacterium]
MDLHLHTPASSDYQQEGVTYLDILKRAETRAVDIIAFTDHNTVAGYRKMYEEIEQLRLLENLKRILPEETSRLKEYERLLRKVLVLPGFEFTATFGFHILGVFPPEKPIREIEHILLDLNVPSDQLDEGSVTVGASADVLSAYEAIRGAGGLAIAAHANSSNGVAMRGFPFGGQTKIAYTQDPHLHALEVTDLDQPGGRTTAGFFSGIKPEYPRRMHCIQGSDAHRLDGDPARKKNPGVGERVTEVLLSSPSFAALEALFSSNDFARTRPRRKQKEDAEYDYIQAAQGEGGNIIQDFHEQMTVRGGKLYAVIADVCAFANTNGGTLYIGLGRDPKATPPGVSNAQQAVKQLEQEISTRISPPLACTVDSHHSRGKNILRILVPRGEQPPYAVDESKIYIREENETSLAVRDEIVNLILSGQSAQRLSAPPIPEGRTRKAPAATPPLATTRAAGTAAPPRTGVEIVSVTERDGQAYYTVKDLRNGNQVTNVTIKSARRLWHYAITKYAEMPKDLKQANVKWHGDLGLLRSYKMGQGERFDLVQRGEESPRFYFGVTEDGIDGQWRQLLGLDE